MHWSRWGDPGHTGTLPEAAIALLELAFGPIEPRATIPLEDVRLPPARLDAEVLAAYVGVVGELNVSTADEARLRHTHGKSTPDLLAAREGDFAAAPDAVVRPADHDEVLAVLRLSRTLRVAVVPYGGGTSVVSGLSADGTTFAGVIALDLARLDHLLAVDVVSSTATLEAGVLGPRAEELLAEHGMTLGHFPQSFEYASIGGFAATRSSGQSSSGYGRFDSMVVSLKVATPDGTWELGVAPASAAGPDLRQVVLGSEGAFGVITEVTVAVRPVPAERAYETWRFASFEGGADAMRALVQGDVNPTVLRLSDELETAVNLAKPEQIGSESGGGALMLCGYEGTEQRVRRMREELSAVLRERGGTFVGEQDGRDWAAGRFSAPYLRDALLDNGVLVETVETATTWSNLPRLYAAVQEALAAALTTEAGAPMVLCHISHVYRTGASLYFTVAAKELVDGRAQWALAKAAVGDAIVAAGGTITHHHAVGRDHKPWLAAEIGDQGVAVLRAVKQALDPEGILNPGVLIP
ncbi:alkyldihydroxyacetonephosphate synthase [Rudaeicoccus suwonensis]|uniref:Alkyldihydroxyacetonephosphate synthase n=2 Tax=Rudaeicoccus suwonensis TaxID=657409 RepID=A0A561E7E4_9MICO|nr:alkyldihydroxyacetonephosphate synthase [Rudaeicoccus suwonensis]